MLILEREVDQRIMIGDDIILQVMRIDCGQQRRVRIGIEAPASVAVHREEVWREIRGEKK